MKKTLTINLGGFVFNIDEDACDQLSQYLADIEKRFPEEERTEIIRDIEERMAELLTYKLQNRNVVETNDVEEVIEVIGKPEQFEDESGEGQTENAASTDKSAFADKSASANGGKTPERKSRRTRKLYRNSNDRMVSGVEAEIKLNETIWTRPAYSTWSGSTVPYLRSFLNERPAEMKNQLKQSFHLSESDWQTYVELAKDYHPEENAIK